MNRIIDDADRKILRELQRDSSRSVAQIAAAVGLSHAPCWRRVQQLRADGLIVREAAVLDRVKLGWEIELFLLLKASPHGRANVEEFRQLIMRHERVIGYYIILGNTDAMVHILAKNMRDYNDFYQEHLATLPHLSEINTLTVLSRLKDGDVPV